MFSKWHKTREIRDFTLSCEWVVFEVSWLPWLMHGCATLINRVSWGLILMSGRLPLWVSISQTEGSEGPGCKWRRMLWDHLHRLNGGPSLLLVFSSYFYATLPGLIYCCISAWSCHFHHVVNFFKVCKWLTLLNYQKSKLSLVRNLAYQWPLQNLSDSSRNKILNRPSWHLVVPVHLFCLSVCLGLFSSAIPHLFAQLYHCLNIWPVTFSKTEGFLFSLPLHQRFSYMWSSTSISISSELVEMQISALPLDQLNQIL